MSGDGEKVIWERVRFVHRERSLVERILRQPAEWGPLDMDPPLDISQGAHCWIAQTFLHLRRIGVPVRLASRPSSKDLNVLHYDHVPGWKRLPFRSFLLVVQADRARPMLSDMRIVQNRLGLQEAGRDHFVPLWSQPGLLPRDPGRGERLTALGYFGLEGYLAPAYREPDFRRTLDALGVDFERHHRPEEWSDYRSTDAVFALRDITDYDLSIKPATKLVNAWKAGCLPLLGPEPAYRQIGRPDVDYVEVRDVEALLRVLRRFKAQPEEAVRMRAAGAAASAAYGDDELVRRWAGLLQGSAWPAFEAWRREGTLCHLRRFPARLAAHRREVAHFWAHI